MKILMHADWVQVWKETVRTNFKVLSQYLPRQTKQDHEKNVRFVATLLRFLSGHVWLYCRMTGWLWIGKPVEVVVNYVKILSKHLSVEAAGLWPEIKVRYSSKKQEWHSLGYNVPYRHFSSELLFIGCL